MKIIEKSVADLVPYENNPRNNTFSVDKVAESIKEFGFKVPILIDKNNVIIAGHTRLKAAEQLGLESVPCILVDDLTEDQIAAFRLIDNKTGELAEWDFDKMREELDEIELDMSEFGFDDFMDGIESFAADVPDSFDEIDELSTTHRCPYCNYEW